MWFYVMVAQWMGYNRQFGNSIVSLLVASQGFHKSTFCRRLLPPELCWDYLDNLKFDNQKLVIICSHRQDFRCSFILQLSRNIRPSGVRLKGSPPLTAISVQQR